MSLFDGFQHLDSIYSSDQELRGGTIVRDRWMNNAYGLVVWWGHGSQEGTSVGYGGLPNEDGVVELDSSVMDGPAGNNAGAVASLRNIKNPSKVARLVMEAALMATFTALTTLNGKAQAEALGEALERIVMDRLSLTPFETPNGSFVWRCGDGPVPDGAKPLRETKNGTEAIDLATIPDRYLPPQCRSPD